MEGSVCLSVCPSVCLSVEGSCSCLLPSGMEGNSPPAWEEPGKPCWEMRWEHRHLPFPQLETLLPKHLTYTWDFPPLTERRSVFKAFLVTQVRLRHLGHLT